jgi:hypothetical protein
MAKFDISPVNADAESCGGSSFLNAEERMEANVAPGPAATRLRNHSTRMPTHCKGLGTLVRGGASPLLLAVVLHGPALWPAVAAADPTTATTVDEVPRAAPPEVPPATFRPSWDLDGLYVWLGPTGAASHIDGGWDSTFGGQLAMLRVRERSALGAIGGSLGAARWTERGGGRVWLDAAIGTRLGSRMVGATAGGLVELGDLNHPRLGGSVGVWTFVGVTPFVRVGVVQELGGFAELGLHVALPVWRR